MKLSKGGLSPQRYSMVRVTLRSNTTPKGVRHLPLCGVEKGMVGHCVTNTHVSPKSTSLGIKGIWSQRNLVRIPDPPLTTVHF